jgi:RimJ/RimL family protein N-acetyltransferase
MFDYILRKGAINDHKNLKNLHQVVAKISGGIARSFDEITDDYISTIIMNALKTGYLFVAEYKGNIIGSMHTYALGPQVFAHTLGEITIVVHSEFQGKGIGSKLIGALLNEVQNYRPDILRVELSAHESNINAIKLYEKLGFVREGRLENRVKGLYGFEADILMAWFNKKFKFIEL